VLDRKYLSGRTRLTCSLLSALKEAAPCCGRGCDTRSSQIRLDKGGEHVCPVSDIPRVCLDEERFERLTNIGQTLVVPNEEAARKGCRQHVEGASDVHLVAEARAMVGRRHQPVIGWQCRGLGAEVAEVVEGDADNPC